jgi:hypothetical protein
MVKVTYNTRTQSFEEMVGLNKRVSDFLKHYEILGPDSVTAMFGPEGVIIHPLDEKIQGVYQTRRAGGCVRSTPEGTVLKIRDILYTIVYNPKD